MAFIRLYDNAYTGDAQDVYRKVRAETYDLDLGQTGWMTAEELRGYLPYLDLSPHSRVLEVGCGAGGCALYLAQLTNAHVTGIDINEKAIAEAQALAKSAQEIPWNSSKLMQASGFRSGMHLSMQSFRTTPSAMFLTGATR